MALLGAVVTAAALLLLLALTDLRITDEEEPGRGITAQENLVQNAGAEAGLGLWGESGGASLRTVKASGSGASGSRVFLLKRTEKGEGSVSAFAPDLTVAPGDTISASAYVVSIPAGRRANMSLDWKSEDGEYLETSPGGGLVERKGGLAYVSGTAPEQADVATIVVTLLEARHGEILEFDAVVAEKSKLRRRF